MEKARQCIELIFGWGMNKTISLQLYIIVPHPRCNRRRMIDKTFGIIYECLKYERNLIVEQLEYKLNI